MRPKDLPFKLTVNVHRRPNLRSEHLEMKMFMGRGVLESLFDKMQIDTSARNVEFSFPETWLNILEQRQLLARLQEYCPNLESVIIDTHSVYIIQCTPNGCVFIVTPESAIDKPPINETDKGKLYYHE